MQVLSDARDHAQRVRADAAAEAARLRAEAEACAEASAAEAVRRQRAQAAASADLAAGHMNVARSVLAEELRILDEDTRDEQQVASRLEPTPSATANSAYVPGESLMTSPGVLDEIPLSVFIWRSSLRVPQAEWERIQQQQRDAEAAAARVRARRLTPGHVAAALTQGHQSGAHTHLTRWVL